MNRELIIDASGSEVQLALLEEKLLVELHQERTNAEFGVGDIYLGRVRRIMQGLNAAFVDVGYDKDAFLHYLDLGPQVQSLSKFTRQALLGKLSSSDMEQFQMEEDIDKTGRISNVLKPNMQVLVQIAKEPISTKGPRITSEISFPGRYLVLVPFSNRISVSQKIKSQEERNRLKRLVMSIKPRNFGVIIRTVAENKLVAELDLDLKNLVQKWEAIAAKLQTSKAPQKILSELDRTSTILRDLLNESFNSIHVNDAALAEEIKNYIRTISPDQVSIVKLYHGRAPIFEFFGIDKQIKSSFGKVVTIKKGTYLIVEQTEALHVIDINSGHRINTENSQEGNALEVNLEAATEVARQMRLRDLGGIIVVDFIDMTEGSNRRKLYEKLKDEMKRDRAKHTILPPSKFGLVQITRQRVRPAMNIAVLEKCPTCEGTGEIKPSIILTDEIENNLSYLIHEQNEKQLTLSVHPYVYAFLKQGMKNFQVKWWLSYKQWVRLRSTSSYHLLEYHFFNRNNDEIKI